MDSGLDSGLDSELDNGLGNERGVSKWLIIVAIIVILVFISGGIVLIIMGNQSAPENETQDEKEDRESSDFNENLAGYILLTLGIVFSGVLVYILRKSNNRVEYGADDRPIGSGKNIFWRIFNKKGNRGKPKEERKDVITNELIYKGQPEPGEIQPGDLPGLRKPSITEEEGMNIIESLSGKSVEELHNV